MNTENLSIRKAITNDISSVMEVIKSCTIDMISKKIFQWNDKYPNIETFKKDIINKDLYVLVTENEILGCVSITFEMDDFYKKIDWISNTNKNIYVHRLAIHPKYQGLGYAKKMMSFIENMGVENMCESIRLDTFSMNEKNNNFYSRLGYEKLGQIYFRDQSDMPFNCYEKPLK
jgi:ribosomal protein S18 acetylase RimI-like enzyme